MNRQELLENYTMEQLAEMVIKYKNASEVKTEEILKYKLDIHNLKESNGRLQASVDTYVKFILPRATREAKELIDNHHYAEVRIIAIDDEKKCNCGKEDEINRLKKELDSKETTINQIDDILDELFGVTHDDVVKPEEFESILREKAENYKTISELLPTEPIKVADILISAENEYEDRFSEIFGGVGKGKYRIFDISELRQIAEHLLIYCNANREGEE